MIKKIPPIIFLAVICYFLFIYKATPLPPAFPSTPTPVPTVTETPIPEITLKSRTLRYYYRQIKDNELITLIPNFNEQQSSDQIIKNNNCLFGINGGFYLPESKPLGLFEINETKLGKYSPSHTFNGFLRQSIDDHPVILDYNTLLSLSSTSKFILQSGPLYNLQSPKINFADTKAARRHLIAQDSKFNTYIFSVFGTESNYDGPTLNEIYEFFGNPEIKKIADFTVALNLDGGSASTFYDQSQDIHVREIKPIGSFLCGQLRPNN